MDWQPIETAPTGDDWVLLWEEGLPFPVYGFRSGPEEWSFVDDPLWDDLRQEDICPLNGWRDGYGPSHWAAIPAPPKGMTIETTNQ